MEMNQTETVLLNLLKASLHEMPVNFEVETDWNKIFSEARIQAVVALVSKRLPETLTQEQLMLWRKAQYAQIANYVRYVTVQDELCRLFEQRNIPMVIVKGLAAAIYYPQPSLRSIGDIDFIVPQAYLADGQRIMQEAGFKWKSSSGGRHFAFHKNGITLELHYHFSYPDLNIEDYIATGFQQLQYGSIDGHEFPMLPRLANGLVLLAHMREHLRCGLGLRQVIDWMMFVKHELNDAFWYGEFCAAAKEKHLETLAVTATRLCQIYLGLPETVTWCADADEVLCSKLMERLLSAGNFGNKNSAGNLIGGVATNIRKEGLFSYLQRVGERDWKLYHKHRWLKPFAWVYESAKFLRKIVELKRSRKPLLSAIICNNEHYELLKELNLL